MTNIKKNLIEFFRKIESFSLKGIKAACIIIIQFFLFFISLHVLQTDRQKYFLWELTAGRLIELNIY